MIRLYPRTGYTDKRKSFSTRPPGDSTSRSSLQKMLLTLFHLTAVAVNVYSLWYDQMYLDLPFAAKDKTDQMPFKGRLMFLTIWGLVLQTLYYSVSLLNDLFGSHEAFPKRRPLIRSIKDLMFSLAFPTGLYVSTSFWAIYSYDKELIFPDALEKVFPVWLNHTMHTTVGVFIILELLLSNITYPPRKLGLTLALTFNLSYIAWMHILHARFNAWVYPIFEVLNLPMRIVFLSCSLTFGISYYFLGEKLNSLVSSAPKKQSKSEPKKKRK